MCCRAVSPTLKFSLMYFSMAGNSDEPFRFFWATIAAFTISANFGWSAGYLAPVFLVLSLSDIFSSFPSFNFNHRSHETSFDCVEKFSFHRRTAEGSRFNFQTLFTLCSDVVCACLQGSRPSNFSSFITLSIHFFDDFDVCR